MKLSVLSTSTAQMDKCHGTLNPLNVIMLKETKHGGEEIEPVSHDLS